MVANGVTIFIFLAIIKFLSPRKLYSVFVFFEKSSNEVFFTPKCCCYLLKGAGNALSKENAVVSVTGNDRNAVWHSTTHSVARRAIQNANQVQKSQAVHLGPPYFFGVCSRNMSRRRSMCLVELMTVMWRRFVDNGSTFE